MITEPFPDARRVAPISACVLYQTDRLKSKFEAREKTVMPGNCALMGATRPASEYFSATPSSAGKPTVMMFYKNCLHLALCFVTR